MLQLAGFTWLWVTRLKSVIVVFVTALYEFPLNEYPAKFVQAKIILPEKFLKLFQASKKAIILSYLSISDVHAK